VLLLEGLTVQVAGGAWLSSPGKHTWGTQPSSLCCPGLLPTPLSIIACALQSPLMVQAELETPGSWRKDQLGQRHSLVPLGCEPAACPWSPPLTVVLRSTFCELLEVSLVCVPELVGGAPAAGDKETGMMCPCWPRVRSGPHTPSSPGCAVAPWWTCTAHREPSGFRRGKQRSAAECLPRVQ